MTFNIITKIDLSNVVKHGKYKKIKSNKINYQYKESTYTPNQTEENHEITTNIDTYNDIQNNDSFDVLNDLGLDTLFADILMMNYATRNGVANTTKQTQSLLNFLLEFPTNFHNYIFDPQALSEYLNQNISDILNSNDNERYSNFFSSGYGQKINDMASDNMKYGSEQYNQLVSTSSSALVKIYTMQNHLHDVLSLEDEFTEAGCNIAMGFFAFTQGSISMGENVLDGIISLGTPFVGALAWCIDFVAGTDFTNQLYDVSNAFVAEDHTNNLFNEFYESTPQGQFLNEHASEPMQYGNIGYNLASGAGSIFTILAGGYLLLLASPALAAVAPFSLVLAGIGGLSGFGRGRAQALNEGADTTESYIAGTFTGLWEGFQWYVGGVVSGNGAVSVLADVFGAGVDPFVYSGIQSGYNGKDFWVNFEQNGGIQSMLVNMGLAGLFSGFSEIREFRKQSSPNVSPSINTNITDDINTMRKLMNDSNVTKDYSDFVTSYKNEYAGELDELDSDRILLYQTHQKLFVDSGFESALEYLEQYGLAHGQGAGYSKRIIEYYLETGDSSVFTRQNGIRDLMKSYSREDLANMLALQEQYDTLINGNVKPQTPSSNVPHKYSSASDYFELNRGHDGSFGVDQGVTAKPDFPNSGEVYNDVINNLRNKGFNKKQAEWILKHMNDTGACSYAEICNEIFNSFKNNPDEFERIFGYPMYRSNGELNDALLITDLYTYANSAENGGSLFHQSFNGMTIISKDTTRQQYLSDFSNGQNEQLINSFLQSKDPNLSYNVEYLGSRLDQYYSMNFNPLSGERIIPNYNSYTGQRVPYDTASLKNRIDSALASDRNVGMDIWYPNQNGSITFHSLTDGGRDISTAQWNEGNGHAVFVTGTDSQGVIVSTWGGKYRINWSDLQSLQFTVSSSTLTIN